MTEVNLVDAFAQAITNRAHAVRYGDGELLTLPWSFADGDSLSLLVTVERGHYTISDRGQAADALAIAGVDLSTRGASASWQAVRRSTGVPPAVMAEDDPYVLSASATEDTLAEALIAVGETMLRADGLRVLATHRRAVTFSDRVIRRVSTRSGLAVVPHAKLRTRHGGERQVTCRVDGRRQAYVQALSGSSNILDAYDHTRAVFADAGEPRDSLVVLVADDAKLQSWQRSALSEVSTVVLEREQDDLWADLASAA